jgi:hypothetical protein
LKRLRWGKLHVLCILQIRKKRDKELNQGRCDKVRENSRMMPMFLTGQIAVSPTKMDSLKGRREFGGREFRLWHAEFEVCLVKLVGTSTWRNMATKSRWDHPGTVSEKWAEDGVLGWLTSEEEEGDENTAWQRRRKRKETKDNQRKQVFQVFQRRTKKSETD